MILNIFMTTIQYVRICCIVVYWIIEGSIIIRWCSAVQAHPVWHASSSWIPASALTLNFPPWMLYLNMTFNWTSVNWKRSWWQSCLIFRRLLPTFIFKFRLILKSRAWNPCYSTGCPQKEKFVIIFSPTFMFMTNKKNSLTNLKNCHKVFSSRSTQVTLLYFLWRSSF